MGNNYQVKLKGTSRLRNHDYFRDKIYIITKTNHFLTSNIPYTYIKNYQSQDMVYFFYLAVMPISNPLLFILKENKFTEDFPPIML